MKRTVFALLLALGAICGAFADTVPAQTFTAPGIDSSPTNTFNLNTCSLQVSGTGSWTIVPQGSNDAGLTYPNTVTTIGTGSITTAGTFSGSIAGPAGSFFRFQVTAVSGSVSIVKTCTPQIIPSTGGGGGGSVTQGTVPWTVAGSVGLAAGTNAIGSILNPYSMLAGGQTATASSGVGVLGVYNATPTTLTNAQAAPVQLDVNGYALMNVAASSGFGNAAGTNGTLALTVQGINGGVQLPVALSYTSASPLPVTTSIPAITDAVGGISVGYDGSVASNASPLPVVLNAGSAIAGKVGIDQTTGGTTNLVNALACDATTHTSCANVITTFADAQVSAQNRLWTAGIPFFYNGSTADKARSVGVGNTFNGTGLQAVGVYGEYLTTLPTMTNATYSNLMVDSSDRLLISPTGLPTPLATQPVSGTVAFSNTTLGVSAVTGNGATRFATATITSNAVQSICSSACTAYDLSVVNATSSACYVQEFNTASGSVTLGTTAPVRVLLVAANSEGADNISPTVGLAFSTAWSAALTTTPTGSTTCGSTGYLQADYK